MTLLIVVALNGSLGHVAARARLFYHNPPCRDARGWTKLTRAIVFNCSLVASHCDQPGSRREHGKTSFRRKVCDAATARVGFDSAHQKRCFGLDSVLEKRHLLG